MILNCAIIDADPSAAELLKGYVEKTPTLKLMGAFTSTIQAVETICHNHLDILFLAIQMPELSGLEFARIVPKNVKVIFTTVYKEYAIEGYKVNAFDYLLKPISYEAFLAVIEREFENYEQEEGHDPIQRDGFLVVKSDYKLVRIALDEILFMEATKDYVNFHLEGKRSVMSLTNLKKLEERLPPETFKRVHRSFIANMSKFDNIERMRLIYGNYAVPISESFKDEIGKYIEEHMI